MALASAKDSRSFWHSRLSASLALVADVILEVDALSFVAKSPLER